MSAVHSSETSWNAAVEGHVKSHGGDNGNSEVGNYWRRRGTGKAAQWELSYSWSGRRSLVCEHMALCHPWQQSTVGSKRLAGRILNILL